MWTLWFSIHFRTCYAAIGALVIRQKPSAKPQARLEMFDDLNIVGLGALRQQVLNFADPMFKWLAFSVTTF